MEKVDAFAQVTQHISGLLAQNSPVFQGFLPRGCFFGSELKLRSLFSGECRTQVIPQDPPVQCIMSVDAVKGMQLGEGEAVAGE